MDLNSKDGTIYSGSFSKNLCFLSRFMLFISGAALGIIVFCYCFEVAARYFFNSPTIWAHDIATSLLCVVIFFAAPEITKSSGHISISFLQEAISKKSKIIIVKVIQLISFAACSIGCIVNFTQNIHQFRNGIKTMGTIIMPKWWISIFITLGLAVTALIFLQQFLGKIKYLSEGSK